MGYSFFWLGCCCWGAFVFLTQTVRWPHHLTFSAGTVGALVRKALDMSPGGQSTGLRVFCCVRIVYGGRRQVFEVVWRTRGFQWLFDRCMSLGTMYSFFRGAFDVPMRIPYIMFSVILCVVSFYFMSMESFADITCVVVGRWFYYRRRWYCECVPNSRRFKKWSFIVKGGH